MVLKLFENFNLARISRVNAASIWLLWDVSTFCRRLFICRRFSIVVFMTITLNACLRGIAGKS